MQHGNMVLVIREVGARSMRSLMQASFSPWCVNLCADNREISMPCIGTTAYERWGEHDRDALSRHTWRGRL